MKAKLITLFSLCFLSILSSYAMGPTFYYKFHAEATPTGQGKVYVSNKDSLDTNKLNKEYTTYKYSESLKVQVEAVSVTAYLFAQPEVGYQFMHWAKVENNGSETIISHAANTTDLVTVLSTDETKPSITNYKAYFAPLGEIYCTSSNDIYGTVESSNPSNKIGDSVTLTAHPDHLNGRFIGWRHEDSSTLIPDNPYTTVVTSSNKGHYTAVFESNNIETDGLYVYLENMYQHKYLGVTGNVRDSITEQQRNFYNTMVLIDGKHKKIHSTPALVLKIKGTPTGTGGFNGVNIEGQGTSTYEAINLSFNIEKYDTLDYFIFGRAQGFTGYLKDNADKTTKGDMELIGPIRYPNIYNRPNDEVTYRWQFHVLNEANLDKYYFGALPSPQTTQEGKYYTTMYTAFPYRCLDGVKAYTIDKIRSDGNAHLVEVQDGIVPAKTAVILECNSTEVANNRLLPLLTDPAELTGTNLLKGEIYLKDGSNDESNYRTLFDPQTMRVLSNDKAAFTNENIKDDAHNNVTLTYIANNTCYLDVSKIRKPKNEIKFTKDDIEPLLGDVNEDGKVNIIDVLAIANYIINIPQEVFNFNNGDTDFNNTINVIDMMWVVNYILAHQ